MKSSRPKKKPLKKKKKKAKNDFKRMKRKDNNSEPPGCLKTFKKGTACTWNFLVYVCAHGIALCMCVRTCALVNVRCV